MSREERQTTRQGRGRAKRVPLGRTGQKMARKATRGMVGRWINDTPGRIKDALRAGYKHVMETSDLDGEEKPVSMVVGTTPDGHPLTAFYMEIPKEFYQEDQAAKQKEVDRIDDAIRRGATAGEEGTDGRYIPSQGISMRAKTTR